MPFDGQAIIHELELALKGLPPTREIRKILEYTEGPFDVYGYEIAEIHYFDGTIELVHFKDFCSWETVTAWFRMQPDSRTYTSQCSRHCMFAEYFQALFPNHIIEVTGHSVEIYTPPGDHYARVQSFVLPHWVQRTILRFDERGSKQEVNKQSVLSILALMYKEYNHDRP